MKRLEFERELIAGSGGASATDRGRLSRVLL